MKEKQADRGMQDLRPTVWIGKQGCTGTIIQEIVSQLDKRNLVKVKFCSMQKSILVNLQIALEQTLLMSEGGRL
jgi:RNA-binding protein YhbY